MEMHFFSPTKVQQARNRLTVKDEQKDNAIASKEAHKLTRQLAKEEQALLVAQR
jgi:hypothetical protein